MIVLYLNREIENFIEEVPVHIICFKCRRVKHEEQITEKPRTAFALTCQS